jgi:hypothetical protein
MLSLNEALDLLNRCSFRIPIEQNAQGDWEFGTGFFITPTGFALTAFHNLPKAVVANGGGMVNAFYGSPPQRPATQRRRAVPRYARTPV